MSGAQILIESLIANGVDTVFGYPGGSIIPTYDALYDYRDRLRHILVRHEQGAVHAAQGYARIKSVPGVVLVTSGPGATNVITGIADAMIDSTPLVVIAGQVGTDMLGTDAFQETDFVNLTSPISKWTYQIRRPEDVAMAVAKAFYIAASGRPGPVVLDFTKNAQTGTAVYEESTCDFIRSYVPVPEPDMDKIKALAAMINEAERPFVVFGQGVILSGAEKQLEELLEKADIPAGSTLLGLSALNSDNPRLKGMLGMHGSIACNMMTQQCDLLLAIGMRFDDRVTGKVSVYAKQAKIAHIDIDASEIDKNVKTDLSVLGDARQVLQLLLPQVREKRHRMWNEVAKPCEEAERKKVILPETAPSDGLVNPGEIVSAVAQAAQGKAIVVTDVGQNQMLAARYSRFCNTRSFISSGGLGTMGFGLPAAIGASVAAPGRSVVLFVGDGGLQMTIEELGTVMQEKVPVKIVLLDNGWLGNVRQWQELFYDSRYSFTKLVNPEFEAIAKAYGIDYSRVRERSEIKDAVAAMLDNKSSFILHACVKPENMVYPMIAPGKAIDEIMLNEKDMFTK